MIRRLPIIAMLGVFVSVAAGVLTYKHHPFWSGGCISGVFYFFADVIRAYFKKREKLSTDSLNYKYGWADGWNSCRSAKPENRTFKRADIIV